VVGRCTSTIWIADILSSTDLGVSPGARDRNRCFRVIGVLQPAIAQSLIGEVVHVLEDGEARHQPRGQGRLSRAVGVGRVQLAFQEIPIDGTGHSHKGMGGIDDLIEARAQQVLLAPVLTFGGPHGDASPGVWQTSNQSSPRRVNRKKSGCAGVGRQHL
jgi:hypothetical protein